VDADKTCSNKGNRENKCYNDTSVIIAGRIHAIREGIVTIVGGLSILWDIVWIEGLWDKKEKQNMRMIKT